MLKILALSKKVTRPETSQSSRSSLFGVSGSELGWAAEAPHPTKFICFYRWFKVVAQGHDLSPAVCLSASCYLGTCQISSLFDIPEWKVYPGSTLFITGIHVCSDMGHVCIPCCPSPIITELSFSSWLLFHRLTHGFKAACSVWKICAFCEALHDQYFLDPCVKTWFCFFTSVCVVTCGDGCIIKSLTFFQFCYHWE